MTIFGNYWRKMKINKKYKIKGKSKYFKEKYGTSNPTILIEDTDKNVFGTYWGNNNGNPTCLLYAMRNFADKLPISGTVYYGKIGHLGELVHESELEELNEKNSN
jgi:hypothetical protein